LGPARRKGKAVDDIGAKTGGVTGKPGPDEKLN